MVFHLLTTNGNKYIIYPQTLNNKAKKNAYKVQDLIELGDLTHTELCLRDLETKEVIMTFKKSDLEIGND